MYKIVIIHFQPIELYPPVINLLDFMGSNVDDQVKTQVLTLHPPPGIEMYRSPSTAITIHRMGKITSSTGSIGRYFNYMVFYLSAIARVVRVRPHRMLSFETLSFFPVYFYHSIFNRKVEIFVHYHEYTSPAEYQQGMILSKWMHALEKKLYPVMKWVSHTNELRMSRFIEDQAGRVIPAPFILPNYPPATWKALKQEKEEGTLKIVYVGALGLETLYIREFAEWVSAQRGRVQWDIYSNNAEQQVIDYLASGNHANIHLKGAIPYSHLPGILGRYDVGVILYKGHIQNYVLNAPNKLFEYFACGLDVWFPKVMTGSLPYITTGTYPKVVVLDFERLDDISIEKIRSRAGLSFKPSEYYSEKVLPTIVAQLTKTSKESVYE